jgi:gamma-glutamylcyclotransferase (GGCT)/AIG2-like uncharacterized protein YtfP
MSIDHSAGRVFTARPVSEGGHLHLRPAQVVGEVYMCPKESVARLDEIYGHAFEKTVVKIRLLLRIVYIDCISCSYLFKIHSSYTFRHSAIHFLAAIMYIIREIPSNSSLAPIPCGDYSEFLKLFDKRRGRPNDLF